MNILITGVAGFIGSNLAAYALGLGHRVIGIDNFNDYYDPKIKEFNISEFVNNPKFVLYRGDITDRGFLSGVFEKEDIDAIVHLAAWAGVTYSIDNPDIYLKTNILGTNNLAELSIKHNINSFVFASTSSIYGSNNLVPYVENMDTSHPLAPYPASKKSAEVLLYTYSKNFNLNVTIFRFFNPIGPRLRPDLALPRLIKAALYDDYKFPLYQSLDDSGRDYTLVTNMLQAMVYVCEIPNSYEIMNLGNSKPVKLRELIEAVEFIVGKKVKIEQKEARKGEMQHTYADITKAKDLINYNPVESLEDMVKAFYDWYKKQPEWYREIGIH